MDHVWIDSSYENVRAECPSCRRISTFNRRSDLKGATGITNMTVQCLQDNCKRYFAIVGDSTNESFEMLVYDTYELVDSKRYMAAIRNLAQAHEVFFATWLRGFLAYRPYVRAGDGRLDQLNARLADLFEATKQLTFGSLRAIFLRLVLRECPSTLMDSIAMIAEIPDLVRDPSDRELGTCEDPRVWALLRQLKSSRINELRNRVVHQRAYRPSAEEAVGALAATRETLFELAALLDVHDDLNWYVHHPDQSQGELSEGKGVPES